MSLLSASELQQLKEVTEYGEPLIVTIHDIKFELRTFLFSFENNTNEIYNDRTITNILVSEHEKNNLNFLDNKILILYVDRYDDIDDIKEKLEISLHFVECKMCKKKKPMYEMRMDNEEKRLVCKKCFNFLYP